VWKPEILVKALYTSNACSPLIDCICLAIGTFGAESFNKLGGAGQDTDLAGVGKKRKTEERENISSKRQKMTKTNFFKHGEEECEISNTFPRLLFQLVAYLKPDSELHNSMTPENAINALSVLCIAFSSYWNTSLSASIFEHVVSWIPWICKQVCRNRNYRLQLVKYSQICSTFVLIDTS
jgi:serine/threonine-protein kinase ATR